MNEKIFNASLGWSRIFAGLFFAGSALLIYQSSLAMGNYEYEFATKTLYNAQGASLLLLASGLILGASLAIKVQNRSLRFASFALIPCLLVLSLLGLRYAGAGTIAWSVVDEIDYEGERYAWLYIDGKQVLGKKEGRVFRTFYVTPFSESTQAVLTPQTMRKELSFLTGHTGTLYAIHSHSVAFSYSLTEHRPLSRAEVNPGLLVTNRIKPERLRPE